MKRFHALKRKVRPAATIHLVSLMDIFTILVFFLLVNSQEPQTLPGKGLVSLPQASMGQEPEKTPVIVLDHEKLSLDGEVILTLAQLNSSTEVNPQLQTALGRYGVQTQGEESHSGRITIVADKGMSYAALRKVMRTCAAANFANISLAVEQTETLGG